MTDPNVCKRCGGTGRKDGTTRRTPKCPDCNGTGFVCKHPVPRQPSVLSSFTAEQRDIVAPVLTALAELREAVAMHLRYLDSVEEKLRYPIPDTEVAANILMQQKRNLRQSAEKTGTLDAPNTTHFDIPKRRRKSA